MVPAHLTLVVVADSFLYPRASLEKEDFATVERRQKAIAFLNDPELLQMYAQSTGDVSVKPLSLEVPFRQGTLTIQQSVAGARLHFTKLLCGYDEDDDFEHPGASTSANPPTPRRQSHQRRGPQGPRSADG